MELSVQNEFVSSAEVLCCTFVSAAEETETAACKDTPKALPHHSSAGYLTVLQSFSFIIYNENPGLVETQKHHKLEEVQRHTYRQHQALEEERPLRSVSSGTGGGNKLRDVQRRRCGIEGSVPGGVPDLHASVFHAEVCPLSHVDE